MKKLLAVLLLTLSGLVYAVPPTQTTTEYCTNLARFARYVTVVRDSNVDRLALKKKYLLVLMQVKLLIHNLQQMIKLNLVVL